jgi:hypothetical protein
MRTTAARCVAVLCACAMLPWTAGCGVIFGGTRQVIQASASPEGATLTTNPPTTDYKTPASISLERKQEYTLTFSAHGYKSRSVVLQRSIRGGILVLDILVGLVGVIIDAATGAWYKLTPEMVSVTLEKGSADAKGPDAIHIALTTKDAGDGQATLQVNADAPDVSVQVEAR